MFDLQGCEPSEVFILQHPFQPFGRRTFNQNGFQTFDARKIIWSGFEQNLLATHNLVSPPFNAHFHSMLLV
jgi:hypothetical protein